MTPPRPPNSKVPATRPLTVPEAARGSRSHGGEPMSHLRPSGAQGCSRGWSPRFAGATRGSRVPCALRPGGAAGTPVRRAFPGLFAPGFGIAARRDLPAHLDERPDQWEDRPAQLDDAPGCPEDRPGQLAGRPTHPDSRPGDPAGRPSALACLTGHSAEPTGHPSHATTRPSHATGRPEGGGAAGFRGGQPGLQRGRAAHA